MKFWVDDEYKIDICYNELLYQITKEGINNIYIKDKNPLNVYVKLLRNFLNNKTSILLDSDFSELEIQELGVSNLSFNEGEYFQKENLEIKSINNLLDQFEENKDNLQVELFTSGTTGRPKKVQQKYSNLIREVKVRPSLSNNIWGFLYNPTHIAGLQVFFQALYNSNKIVYLFNSDYKSISNSLIKNKVTHISCTPTLMKILLNYIDKPVESVCSLTFGGEKFNSIISDRIKKIFPNSKVNNVYASTEAGSLLKSDGDYFEIPNKYSHLIKIENNELLIHQDILGKSETFQINNKWYRTGDVVKIHKNNKFSFISRKSDMINVGGYKVNPLEVENLIRKIKGVLDVSISGKKNSILGNIITARIIKDEIYCENSLKSEINKVLKLNLQEYKRPRLIKFVDSLELTRTGKLKK